MNQLRNHLLYQVARQSSWEKLAERLADDPRVVHDKEGIMETLVPRYGKHRVFDLADMIELLDHWRVDGKDGSR